MKHCHHIKLSGFLMLCVSAVLFTVPAQAQCVCEQAVRITEQTEWNDPTKGTVPVINKFVTDEFKAHRSWFISVLWEDNILPSLQMLSEQASTSAVQFSQMAGSYIDAENQIQTQQAFGEARARAMADYQPSEGMCQFGTGVKSLANSERRSEFNSRLMSQRSLDRQTGRSNSSGAYGAMDEASRVHELRTRFCSKQANNGGMEGFCESDGSESNSDIDYTKTIDSKWTVDVNFSGGAGGAGKDEAAVFALSEYLYSNDSFVRPAAASLAPDGSGNITNMQKAYLDMRGVIAKRSVAESSFNAMIAMKSSGSDGSRDFLAAMLEELGGVEDDVMALMGQNPSYYAQMEVLTKKVYQSPGFYTKLYDTPANVKRKDVALQAIGLMQKFDMLKSYLRTEASLSVLLELAVQDLQSETESELNPQTTEGTPN